MSSTSFGVVCSARFWSVPPLSYHTTIGVLLEKASFMAVCKTVLRFCLVIYLTLWAALWRSPASLRGSMFTLTP